MTTVTLYEEISAFQPKSLTPATFEITNIRQMHKEGRLSDERYQEFWASVERKQWLETRWREQEYNNGAFLKLYGLLSLPEISKTEAAAVMTKFTQFKEKILSYDYTFPALRIDFKKFPFDSKQDADWEE